GRVAPGTDLGPCLATDTLLADSKWTALVREVMLEVITAAGRLGFEIPRAMIEDQIERTRRMGAYKASTIIDFERRQPLEIESVFWEPLRRAEATGAAMPRLRAICQVMAELDPGKPAVGKMVAGR